MYRLKKSLGQHFLKDEAVVGKIIDALRRHSFRNLLEVGAGGGALTRDLSQIENIHFKTVELDTEKVDFLLKKYPALEGKLLHEDFLKMALPFENEFTVIGNFPYNISSQILFKIVEWQEQVPIAIGMFQKEVAQRAAASEGGKEFGVLSVLVQYYYQVNYLFTVPPESFRPPPKVESAVIELIRREDLLPITSMQAFRTLVKTAFNQRRKKLRNSIKSLVPAEVLSRSIMDRRPETLSVADFAQLTFEMDSK